MFFIDVRSATPLYEQIKASIRQQMICGLLQPDDKLPSVRELAQSAAINPNTIQKAYRDLEGEGLIYSLPGRGSFVAKPTEEIRQKRREEILKTMDMLLSELRFLGMSNKEICKHVKGGKKDDD